MKKLWLLVATVAIVSCKKEAPIDYAIISGSVSNANTDKLTLYNMYDFSDKKDITISEDGTFTDTISLDWNHRYMLREGRNGINLYLSKGDQITIDYDSKKQDSTLAITGNGNEITNYYVTQAKKSKEHTEQMPVLYGKDEAAFKESIAKSKEAKLKVLEETPGLSDEFKALETKNINYEYLSSLSRYETYHGYFAKKKDFKTSENFDDELKAMAYDNEADFKFSSEYRNLVEGHYRKEASEAAKKDSTIAQDIAMLKAFGKIENELIRNKLLYGSAQFGITYTEDLEAFYKAFSEGSTDKKNNETIEKSYNALKLLGKGNSSPKFKDYENYAGGTTSLDDLKGKYVYIDVWATWCGPCKAEIPSLKKVEKQYHGKNIEFVSISIDDKKDHGAWKKMIVDKELGGIQLFADNNWDSKFVQDYMIKGIPRFILIDPSGNIVNSNAPRPSDSKLIALFDELKI
ncbi:TlpA family protein disulfide reductase [Pseudotenacibaculum haliotis]|uniref:TlpA family protein disulfide reductase n=1 Tax=Pseudotenacibaculum haliotis TaxID=1862138 RepID=A0ABW5LYP1_9FLAO